MDAIILVGAEDVRRAGHNMADAAEQMSRAALSIQESLSTHIRLMEDIVQRLEWAAQAASAQDSTPRCENGG